MRKFLLSYLFILLTAVCAFAAPVVTISSPANNATVSTTFTISATATPDAGNTISGWRVYIDSVDQTAIDCGTSCGNNYSGTVTVSNGTHTVVVRAWDSTATPNPNYGDKTITVNAVSSSVSLAVSSPAASATVCSPVSVIASATSATTGASVTGWNIYDQTGGGNTLVYNNPGPTSSINTNLTMTGGSKQIQIVAFDSTGASNFVNRSFTITTSGCSGGTATNLNPTTTLAAESNGNTAAWSGYTDQANGDEGYHNISLTNIHSLLYSGNSTILFPNVMLWFCNSSSPTLSWTSTCQSHAQVGYNSSDTTEIGSQINEVASLGYDGIELDWYGRNNWQNTAANNWITALNGRSSGLGSNLKFIVMFDHSYSWSCGNGAYSPTYVDITTCLYSEIDADIDYVNTNWWTSSHTYKYNSRPILIFFIAEGASEFSGANWTTVWNTVRTHASAETHGNPYLLFLNAGAYTHADSDGAFDWVSPCQMNSAGYSCDGSSSTPTTWDQAGLDWFYGQSQNYPSGIAMGAAWKGYDDRFAAWSAPPPNNRFLDQNCGMSWVDSLNEVGRYYSSSHQLPLILTDTWNDYEEGTELESGVGNCYALASGLSGSSTLIWSITGTSGSANIATVDHYTVYLSTDGVNLSVLQDNIAPTTNSLDLSQYGLSGGTYYAYVKLVSKPGVETEVSLPVTYTPGSLNSPLASLVVTPNTGNAPLAVSANVSGSSSGQCETISKQVIDWGDGSPTTALTSTGQTVNPVEYFSPPTTSANNANITAASNWLAGMQLGDGAIEYSSTKINPYFANLAAVGWLQDPTKYANVLSYMKWYVAHLNLSTDVWGGTYSMYDYAVTNGATGSCFDSPCSADSTDSYAGTFLSLAYQAYQTGDTGLQNYVASIQGTLVNIAMNNLVTPMQTNGDGLTWAKASYQIKYLMDNSEVFRGLADFSTLLTQLGNGNASTIQNAANSSLNGVLSLWIPASNEFAVYKDGVGKLTPPVWTNWYPDAVSQMWPIFEGVVAPTDSKATSVYNLLNSNWPGWPTLSFNSSDAFPWVAVAYSAAVMGDNTNVDTYINTIDSKYVNATPAFVWPWYEEEAGFFMRLNSLRGIEKTTTNAPTVATHTYTSPGTYTVKDTVTNSAGLSSSATASVSVTNAVSGSSGALLNTQLSNGAYVYSPLRVQGVFNVAVGPIAHTRIKIDGNTVWDKSVTGTTYNLDKYVFLSSRAWHTVQIEAVDSASPANVYDSRIVKVFCVSHSN